MKNGRKLEDKGIRTNDYGFQKNDNRNNQSTEKRIILDPEDGSKNIPIKQ